MKILVIAEDLRVSGTSEGQVSRSFVYRMAHHPDVEKIDLLYLKNESGNHEIDMLPINQVWQHDILFSKNSLSRFIEKVGHKIVGRSLEIEYKLSKVKDILSTINFENYDYIAVRSSGHSFLTLRAFEKLKFLKDKVVLFFHDPFPVFWDPGYSGPLSKRALYDFKVMKTLVDTGFKCVTPSNSLSRDLRFLYRSKKNFSTLPHQFSPEVFVPSNGSKLKKELNKISIMYHGAIQLGRKIDPFIDSCIAIQSQYPELKNQLSLLFRIKGNDAERLKTKYKQVEFLQILPQVSSQIALWESKEVADINLIIEPSGNYSNILVGKAPLLDYVNRRILILGPKESELKNLIKDDLSFAFAESIPEIKRILLAAIKEIKDDIPVSSPFGDYFSVEKFNYLATQVFSEKSNYN